MSDKKKKLTKAQLKKLVKLLKKGRRRRRLKKQIKQKQQVKQSVNIKIGDLFTKRRSTTKKPKEIKQPTIIRAPTNIIRPPPSYSTFDNVGNRQNVNGRNDDEYQRQLRERAEQVRKLEAERADQQREQQRREEQLREEIRRRQQQQQREQQQQQQQLKRLHEEFNERLRLQEREIVEAVGKQNQAQIDRLREIHHNEIRRYERRIAQLEKDIDESEESEEEEFIIGSGSGKPVQPEQNIAMHTPQQDHNIGHHGDISAMSTEVRKLRRDMEIANALGGGFPMVEMATDTDTDEEEDDEEESTSVSQSQTATAVPIAEASVIEPTTLTQEILRVLNVGRLVEITKEINKSRPRGQKLTTSGPRGGHKTKEQLINQLIGLKISPEWL